MTDAGAVVGLRSSPKAVAIVRADERRVPTGEHAGSWAIERLLAGGSRPPIAHSILATGTTFAPSAARPHASPTDSSHARRFSRLLFYAPKFARLERAEKWITAEAS